VSYRCNDEVRLLAVLDGRERATVEAFLRKIPERLKQTVRAVCCDLYEGYINASKSRILVTQYLLLRIAFM